jgi:hypothetical protein
MSTPLGRQHCGVHTKYVVQRASASAPATRRATLQLTLLGHLASLARISGLEKPR